MNNVIEAKYLTTEQAAEYLHLAVQTLTGWRSALTGPTYSKLGGRVVYSREDLDAWVRLNRVFPGQRRRRRRSA